MSYILRHRRTPTRRSDKVSERTQSAIELLKAIYADHVDRDEMAEAMDIEVVLGELGFVFDDD